MPDSLHVNLPASFSRLKLNEREQMVLCCIAQRAHATSRAVAIGRKELVKATGLTPDQTLRACRSLDRRGLLDVRERYRDDGGRCENAYSLTEAALSLLR